MVMSKTKVAPIKRLTIPRLELCSAHLLARLLHHVRQVLGIPVWAWTDNTIVINWLDGTPKCFKTYVGNRISAITDVIPPDRWRHVNGKDNPADSASRGLFPLELIKHELWWNGPVWLSLPLTHWPVTDIPPRASLDEETQVCLTVVSSKKSPLLLLEKFSSFTRLK